MTHLSHEIPAVLQPGLRGKLVGKGGAVREAELYSRHGTERETQTTLREETQSTAATFNLPAPGHGESLKMHSKDIKQSNTVQ